jgi:prepilin-type N-terminal cleavage/methylation domain-containing protein
MRTESLRQNQRAFTLLELLVVMAIVAMLASLVAPSSLKALQTARERTAVHHLENVLAGLPMRAFSKGAAQRHEAAQIKSLIEEFPPHWDLVLENPLVYSSEGTTRGGEVTLLNGRVPIAIWRIEAPMGTLKRKI